MGTRIHITHWGEDVLDCILKPLRAHQFYPRSPKEETHGAVLGRVGCHGDRSLDNWEWGAGWAQRCPQAESPKGMSGGEDRGRPGLVSPSQLSREPLVRFCHRWWRGAKAAGLHGSGLKDLPARTGMFFYFSCREWQLADRTLDPGNGRRALWGGNPQYVWRRRWWWGGRVWGRWGGPSTSGSVLGKHVNAEGAWGGDKGGGKNLGPTPGGRSPHAAWREHLLAKCSCFHKKSLLGLNIWYLMTSSHKSTKHFLSTSYVPDTVRRWGM